MKLTALDRGRKLLLLALVGFFASTATSQPELKGSPDELRGFLYPSDKIVTISAQAEEKAYSDEAIVSLVITTEDKLLSVAISENGQLRADIEQTLVKKGISAKSINSSKFSSSPQYGWFGSKPASYQVVNRMAINIDKEDYLKEIAIVADKFEEVELSDTAFKHSKKDEFNHAVRSKALDKVKKQKAFYEESLGVKLTPIGIRDSNVHQMATRGAMVLEEVVVAGVRQSKQQERDSYSSVSKYRDQAGGSSFDEVEYRAAITVDFKIEQ